MILSLAVAGMFAHFQWLKMLIFFSSSLRSLDSIEFFFFDLLNRELHFNVLENRISHVHVSTAKREKGHKISVFWSGAK